MRYGGYDLRKASKSQTPSSSQGSFRLKKMQCTAYSIVGKVHSRLHDSLKRFYSHRGCTDSPRSSPISFRDSLFNCDISPGYIKRINSFSYTTNDFRNHFDLEEQCKDRPNYIFGTNVYNISARNILNGKSTIKILNTFKEIEQSNSVESFKTAKNSLQRLKDERKTIFKELLELSSCDESLEYRLIKDYLECNSYSEIENDNEFKDYLQRKKYMDILSYLNESNEPKSLMSISSSLARAQSPVSKGSWNSKKLLSTPKTLKQPKKTPELASHVCQSCRSTLNSRTWKPLPNQLKAPKRRDIKVKAKATNIFSSSYREVVKFCQEFFEESFATNAIEMPKFAFNKFKEQKYEKLIKDFVYQQGYDRVEEYVDDKFGQFIDVELASYCGSGGNENASSTSCMKKCGSSCSHSLLTSEDCSECGYCDQMHSEEMIHLVPASLQGKEDILFGNLHELYTFHNEVFLKDLENCISTTELVALCFVQRRDTFYRLYSFYCQNIPRSERLRETLVDTHLFLQECQKRLGHKLPLAAYLLKPVQRITKYQLLLKDLLRFSDSGSCTKELQKALDCMLIVLKCVNDSMHQVAITGFPMSQIGLTESVRGDNKRFEVWLQGRQEVHTLQAPTIEIKNKWVAEIKRVLLNQLEELKGEKIKQYGLSHRGLRQTTSWDTPNILLGATQRTVSCDASSESSNRNSNCSSSDDNCISSAIISANSLTATNNSTGDKDHNEACGWSSDYSNSEDEMSTIEDNSTPRFINFLAPWSISHHSTTTTTTAKTRHHHQQQQNQNQNHHHNHHNSGASYPRQNKPNSKFYVSVEH
uniref:DH domain-containing protein n=1 Tax=Glossina morsitans morsitans TaxID=37546 RepID=A0A1B0GC97_GLOMM